MRRKHSAGLFDLRETREGIEAMPIYEYTCSQCHEACEVLVRGSEQPRCPTCGNANLEKLLSVPAAPSSGRNELSVCDPAPGPCGRPQCGSGGCAF